MRHQKMAYPEFLVHIFHFADNPVRTFHPELLFPEGFGRTKPARKRTSASNIYTHVFQLIHIAD